MKKSLAIMLVLVVLVSTVLQGTILVWFYKMNQTLFWSSVALLAVTTAVFAYFILRVGVKEAKEYLKDYWSLTLDL